LIATEKSF
jgi:hypothetical protein